MSENSGHYESRLVADSFSRDLPIKCIAQPRLLSAQQHVIGLVSRVDTAYVAQIADDDMWSRYHLEEAFRCFAMHQDIHAFFGKSIAVRNEGCVPFERLSSTLLEVPLGDARSISDFVILDQRDVAVRCMASTPLNIWSVVAKARSHHQALLSSAGDPVYGELPSNDRLYIWRLSFEGSIAVGRNVSLFYRRHAESDVQTWLANDLGRTVHEDYLVSVEIARQASQIGIDAIKEWRELYAEAGEYGLAQALNITPPLKQLLVPSEQNDRHDDRSLQKTMNKFTHLFFPSVIPLLLRKLRRILRF